MYLTKQQIMAANDRVTEDVPVPEWAPADTNAEECFVKVRSLSGRQRDAFEASMLSTMTEGVRKPNLVNMRARFCSLCMVDETGARMWTDAEAELLGERNAAALDRVYTVAQRLSSANDGAVKQLAKNSFAGQPESSPSTSA